MDFIFGTLATDELRLIHQRISKTGVQHAYEISPRSPRPGEPVTIYLDVGHDIPASQAACYYTTDGTLPIGSRGEAINGQVIPLYRQDFAWDTPTMSFTARWIGTIPAQADNTMVHYRISVWDNNSAETYADYPELKATTERAAAAFFMGQGAPGLPPIGSTTGDMFNYHVNQYQPPEWAKSAIIYHVFVDRFYPGDGKKWNKPESLSGFYGGTLLGVRDKMDYIADLGADCIWLSPIFPSPTHHGYDARDYMGIEPRLGDSKALHAVVEAAHNRGIRVLLDLAVNHCSNTLPQFQDALNNPDSPYRDWFTFDDSEIGYKTFFNVESMPVINLQNPEARNWMLDVARYWLREFDIDGYRLDHANGPGPGFWSYFRQACREVKPDSFCFGEVVEAPNILRTYAGKLDGLLDFYAEDALRKRFIWQTMDESQFNRFAEAYYAYFPQGFIMPTFFDNHDMDRFLFSAGNDKQALKNAAAALFSLPGPPIIYYGTEVGLSQENSARHGGGLEESRMPMLWGDEQDKELLEYFKNIIQKRKSGLSG